ncbi:MAG: HAMP domain-containing sensor histidine kinase [Burkholderiaceae bacterium]
MFERIRSQLHWRLSLVLMALFVVFALLAGMILRQFSISYEQEVAQRMNIDVAMYIARQQTLTASPMPDSGALAELFRYVMIVNPAIDVYLLDTEGRVQGYDPGRGPLIRQQVPLDPVYSFLRGADPLPIRGADPRNAADAVFSAAAVGDPARPTGYVYAVLSRAAPSEAAISQGSFGLSAALLSFAIAVLFLGVTGVLLFRSLTGRLRQLAQRVDQFEAGRFTAPQTPPTTLRGGDELARLQQAFETMAAKIAAQFAQIESIDLSRREAVLNASHDLRTPLAALQGYLQTLQIKADVLGAEQRASYLAIAQRHAARISVLVEQMFALAKLDAPETAPKCEAFSLAELAGDIVQKYRLRATEQGVMLTAAVDAGAPPMWADIGMIERLVENLVDNALKFTPSGGTVRVEVRADGAGANELSVADTGRGIADDDLPHIFKRFERGGVAARGDVAFAGSGLGLAIAQRIVDLHAATLDVASRAGEGTRFTVRFPLRPADSLARATATSDSLD